MKLAFLALVMLATASALYIPAQESHLEERGAIVDIATKIQKAIDNIKGILASGSADKRDVEDVKQKMDAVFEEIKKLYNSDTKRGLIVEDIQKMQDVIDSLVFSGKRDLSDLAMWSNLGLTDNLQTLYQLYSKAKLAYDAAKMASSVISKIKSIFSSDADADTKEKRDLVDVATKIEAIIDEIKHVFKSSEPAKRGFFDTMDKAEGAIELYENIKYLANVYKKVAGLIPKIKEILASDTSSAKTKRDLVDVATKIEDIFHKIFDRTYVKGTVISKSKRGVIVDGAQKMQDLVKSGKDKVADLARRIKDMIANIKEIIASGGDVDKRDIVDVATKIEAIIEEIKKVFKTEAISEPTEKRYLVDSAKAKRDLFNVATKIEAIIEEIKNVFRQTEKRDLVDGAIKVEDFANKLKDKLQTMIQNIKGIIASDNVEKRDILDVATKIEAIIDVASKIEAIIEDIKKVFKSDKKRGILVDSAKKIEDLVDDLKKNLNVKLGPTMMNIYGLLNAFSTKDGIKDLIASITAEAAEDAKSAEKRDLVDGAKKVEDFANKMKKKLQTMINNIKGIIASDNVEKRDLVDVAAKIEAIIDEIKKVFKTEAKRGIIADGAEKVDDLVYKVKNKLHTMISNIYSILVNGPNNDSKTRRDLVDVATKLEAIIDEIKKVFKPTEKRDLVDGAKKVEDFANKLKDKLQTMINNIKGIITSDNVEKRDIIDVAAKIEAIIEEIKKVFKSEVKRGLLADKAQQVQDFAEKIKKMMANIKDILASDNESKRGVLVDGSTKLVDVASKIEAIIEEIKKVFKPDARRGIGDLYEKKIQEMVARLKDIMASSEVGKRDLVDVGRGIIVDVGHGVIVDGVLTNIKNILSSDSESKRGVLVDGSQKLVDVAAKIEAIIAEIKNVFKQDNKRGALVDGSQKLVDVAAKIEAIIAEIKNVFKKDTKRGVIVNGAQKIQDFAKKLKEMMSNIKDILTAGGESKRGVLVDGSQKLVDVAAKIEAILAEIKNVFQQ